MPGASNCGISMRSGHDLEKWAWTGRTSRPQCKPHSTKPEAFNRAQEETEETEMGFEDFHDWAAMGRVTVWCASQFEGEIELDPNPGLCSLRCLLFNCIVPAKGAFQ